MGEKKMSKNEVNGKQNHSIKEKDGAKKEGIANMTVVLKTDFHCEGCASKVKKYIRSLQGVESVKCGEGNKLTVIGNVDPGKLLEKVQQKTHQKVELISPVLKKDDGKEAGAGDKKKDKTKENSSSDVKKSKEAPVTTAVMKMNLHCEGCIKKIYRVVTKTKGYQDSDIDREKNLLIVTGSMDMKALAESLKKQLKKEVEIVPAKKEGGGGGEEHVKAAGRGIGHGGGGHGAKAVEGSNGAYSQYVYPNGPNPYNMYPNPNGPNPYNMYPHPNGPNPYNAHVYGSGYPVVHLHAPAPQWFNDENPNACSIS